MPPDDRQDEQAKTAISGDVHVGRDFIGRDKIVQGDEVSVGPVDARAQVAVGDNISQTTIGQQTNIGTQIRLDNLRLVVPALLLLAAALAAAVYFLRPAAGPMRMPQDRFNIAIAEFGVLQPDGRVVRDEFASGVGRTLFEQLRAEYATADVLAQRNATRIWHDSLPRSEKGVTLGLIEGATAVERAASAAVLAERVGAALVVYGYLSTDGNPDDFRLEFYYDSARLRGEPDAIVGQHRLGAPIALPIGFAADATQARLLLERPLAARSRALAWLTTALALDVVGRPDEALMLLLAAEQTLTDWRDDDGREVLYYFIGRAAFWLRDYDRAIAYLERAIALNPTYANAYITLGSTYYDRAQLFFARDVAIDPAVAACVDPAAVARSAPTLDAAQADIARAEALFAQAIAVAPDSPWPPIGDVARLMDGLNRRLASQALLFVPDVAGAQAALAAAFPPLQQAQSAFAAQGQVALQAHSALGLGIAAQTQGHLALLGGDRDGARAAFAAAAAHYDTCLALGASVAADLLLQQNIIECGCTPLRAGIDRVLLDLQGEE